MKVKSPKLKTCQATGCRVKFKQFNSLHVACSPLCAITVVRQKHETKAKAQRKVDRLKRESLRDLKWYVKKAQTSFNAFIRYRDRNELCISCQKRTGAKMNAGHYLSCGARSELRFHPSNCHLQCEHCNSWLSSNAILYRVNLIKKVGVKMVDYMENFNNPQRLTIDDLKEITAHYKQELKYLRGGSMSNHIFSKEEKAYWRNPKSAPMDGTEFIGILKDGLVFKMYARKYVNPERMLITCIQDDSVVPCSSKFNGWLPLPIVRL